MRKSPYISQLEISFWLLVVDHFRHGIHTAVFPDFEAALKSLDIYDFPKSEIKKINDGGEGTLKTKSGNEIKIKIEQKHIMIEG